MAGTDVRFAFAAAPVGEPGTSDQARYDEVLVDCRLGQALGYDGAWMLEHHFTDYFPTPSPLLFMSHVAAHCPGLNLGTCVLVAPWYQPLRLAEEISMLSQLCRGELHLGLGRGTAKIEYDPLGIDMGEARERYRECIEILQLALAGEPFQYRGRFNRMEREARIRPHPHAERIHLYGAIGSPPSAEIMADLSLPPLCVTQFPPYILEKMLNAWNARARQNGLEATPVRPLLVHAFLADTDDQARALGRQHLSRYFAIQVRHYEADLDPWKHIHGYEQFSRMFENLKKLSEPANLDSFMEFNLVGSAETVRGRVQQYLDLGFNYFILQCATEGIPRAHRHDTLRRFAAEIAPDFSEAFRRRTAAAE